MLRVAYLGIKGLPSQAGADRVVEAIARRMPEHGIHPTVYCDRTITPRDVSISGVELLRVPAIPGKHLRSGTLAFFSALHAVLFGKYDLLHLHNLEASFVLPILRVKYPVIATSHGFAYRRDKWGPIAKRALQLMEVPFVKFSNVATSVSAQDAGELASRYRRAIQYIPNGTGSESNPDLKAAQELLDRHALSPGKYLILVAGRIIPTKGVHLAIEAINRLANEIPLLIVGDGEADYVNELREMAGPRVRFQPLIKEPSVLYGLMVVSQCLIFPSLYEAMSMVLLEAAQLGVPIVCSDLPENNAVLGENATYFESGNIDSLTKKLTWVLEHPSEVVRKSERAAKRVLADFSWDVIAARYVELYQEMAQIKAQKRIDPLQIG